MTAAAWILDASVAAKWYLRDEQFLERADGVLARFGSGRLQLVAPAYFLDEAGNILRSAVLRRRLASDRAPLHYAALLDLDITIVEPGSERRAIALHLALAHEIAFYGALCLNWRRSCGFPY